MHTVIETHIYRRAADSAGVSETERLAINTKIAANPLAGALIPGSGGARKVRFPKGNRGQSAGYRVITYYAADDVPVFLMDLYAKGEKVNLTKSEINEFNEILKGLADDWRESVRQKVAQLTNARA